MKNNLNTADCTDFFRSAYENRYTWPSTFRGYRGSCQYKSPNNIKEGEFKISSDYKASVTKIEDELINKSITSQLWEVSIHRVRRSFNSVHGHNTFVSGDTDGEGTEILVGGKSKGDMYKVKDNVITMVRRHLHGKLIIIRTKSIFDTGIGYLSSSYTSEFRDPDSLKVIKSNASYHDDFLYLEDENLWVLSKRVIESTDRYPGKIFREEYLFFDIKSI